MLNVAPVSVAATARRVWESGTVSRVTLPEGLAGRQAKAATAPMAVLVQMMVEAQAAGVAFTANPSPGIVTRW